MRVDTRARKKATRAIRDAAGKKWLADRMLRIIDQGKQAFDAIYTEIGRSVAEAIMLMEREERSGPDYRPVDPEIRKWASQPGSIYIADQKVAVEHPRLRSSEGEVQLETYRRLREPEGFSEELLGRVLRGVSSRRYGETVTDDARAFGVSASSISRHVVDVTAAKLREFKERDLTGFQSFAIFLDTIHRGGEAFVVALGVDVLGEKSALGFWEGATENQEVCKELLADMERRGLILSKRIIWITDGGKGIIKTLKDRFGGKLLHVRCMIHYLEHSDIWSEWLVRSTKPGSGQLDPVAGVGVVLWITATERSRRVPRAFVQTCGWMLSIGSALWRAGVRAVAPKPRSRDTFTGRGATWDTASRMARISPRA